LAIVFSPEKLAATESCMHRAGFSETRSHPTLQIPAKADNQKRWKPARMVYDSMLPPVFYFFSSIINIINISSFSQLQTNSVFLS
jgi:hypothetical protein